MKYSNIKEEELKNKIAHDYFRGFDCTKIIGDIDFCVADVNKKNSETISFLWSEAKQGKAGYDQSITQLILTIGKARTFDKILPPAYLGTFDYEGITFISYSDVDDIFYLNDFNWNVRPSDYSTREFKTILKKVKENNKEKYFFQFASDNKELKSFIDKNFVVDQLDTSKIKIDKNNFMIIYNKWLQTVKPSIGIKWEIAKKSNIIDGDFYLADLLFKENKTLKEKLYVILKKNQYEFGRRIEESGVWNFKTAFFYDNQKSHTQFWNKYERPPLEEYWDYIIERRDLLVPQDVRERKGSFFTPQIWVELSQKYLVDVLGEDWQDEYTIWDCAAGTGNLLNGLTHKYNIYASTLDQQDVDVMKDRIKNGANLLESHVFQFDFLNDDFSKLPQELQKIINDEEKRKKLVIYINPPYAESNGRVSLKRSDFQNTAIYSKYYRKLKKVGAELFAQFLARIYFEIPDCIIAQFSTLKIISATNSKNFRNHFLTKPTSCFVVPANTFDNVKGGFPVGFFIWDTKQKEKFEKVVADVYNSDGIFSERKNFYTYDNHKGKINNWLNTYKAKKDSEYIAFLVGDSPDFQNNNFIFIQNEKVKRHGINFLVNSSNLKIASIYLSVRHCISASWLNDRDQFLYPNDKWQNDKDFQNDCLTYTLFHTQNRISSKHGTNHWIPFTESEVNAKEKFESHFMTDFIQGKIQKEQKNKNSEEFEMNGTLEQSNDKRTNNHSLKKQRTTALIFSKEAKKIFNAGREFWKYYHQQPTCNVNASFYDIREHFQGRNEKDKMNHKSSDEKYTKLLKQLREKLKLLAKKIEPKIYEYEFLKK